MKNRKFVKTFESYSSNKQVNTRLNEAVDPMSIEAIKSVVNAENIQAILGVLTAAAATAIAPAAIEKIKKVFKSTAKGKTDESVEASIDLIKQAVTDEQLMTLAATFAGCAVTAASPAIAEAMKKLAKWFKGLAK